MIKDLTVGKPSTVLWKFCLPLFGSVLFQQLYNLADSFVAGKFISENALAAVGNSYEITLIFIAFAFGCNIGCSVIVSQLFGARYYRDLKTAVYTTLTASGVICGLLMLSGLIFTEDLLRLINTPKHLMADSALYLDIYIWGLPFVFYYNISTGIFTALGDSKTPFYFLAASSTSNIIVDILFVTVFKMGVAGVAWATFLCQGVSCVLAIFFVFKRLGEVEVEGAIPAFSWSLLKRIAWVAVPSFLQQGFVSVGNILIQGIINAFGASVMAGYAASIKLNNLAVSSYMTIGNGVSNYTAQNLGAQKIERVREGRKAGIRLVWMIALPLTLIYFFCGKWLVLIFMDSPSRQALQTGIEILRILSPFYFTISAKLTTDGVLRGAGMMHQFMTATLTAVVLRVGFAKLLSGVFGPLGIWLAWPIGWFAGVAISIFFYRRGRWSEQTF